MRGLFVDDGGIMGRDADTLNSDAAEIRSAVEGRHVCPFCGAVREQAEGVCPRCTMENTAATRQATKSRIGPWYVLQTRNPAAPGMKFETLLTFVHKGRVKARSIVRGPTTHQLWRFAAHVKGLSREFGVCYSCGESIGRSAGICPHCNRLQDPPANPDVFLESAESDARQSRGPAHREQGPSPLVAEDIVVPPMNGGADAFQPPELLPQDKTAQKKGADGFLTAADLAAAFKLDFSEPKGRKHKKAPVAPIAMTRNPRQQASAEPRRRGAVKLVLLVLLLGAVGAGVFQYRKDPGFHAQVDHYYAVSSTWARQKWADLQKPAAKPQHVTPKSDDTQVDVAQPPRDTTTTGQPQTTQPSSSPSPWDKIYNQSSAAASPSNAADEKTDVVPAPSRSETRVTPAVVQRPTAVPAPVTQPPVVQAPLPAKTEAPPAPSPTADVQVEPPAPKPPAAATLDDVRALYRSAIDAEAQGNYASAVQKFEQIQAGPRDLWPRDLQLRLSNARKLAQ